MCSPFATPMMCTPFDIHLAEARRLDRNQKYAKQLNKLDKQHKFVLLRSTYGGNYDAEMRQSLLVDRLFLICEKLSPRPIARLDTKPLLTPNDRLKRCPNCKGKFILLQDTGELCCTQCGLLEAIFGAIFDLQCLYTNYKYQTRPKTRSTKKYNFRYYLNRALEAHRSVLGHTGGALLSNDQITQTLDTFAFIENYLPKRISYPFVAYKILDCILPQGKQRLILAYLGNEIPQSTRHKHERTWNYMLAGLNRIGQWPSSSSVSPSAANSKKE